MCTPVQVAELVDQYRQPRAACKAILQHALAAWRMVGAGDNVAVLVVRFGWQGYQEAGGSFAPRFSLASAQHPCGVSSAPAQLFWAH